MSRERVNQICAALPGPEMSDPHAGELDAWKVGGKMFASFSASTPGLSVKTPSVEDAGLLIEMGRASRAAYFHRSWVHVDCDAVPDDELCDRIHTSYRIVRAGLPKKVQAALPPLE